MSSTFTQVALDHRLGVLVGQTIQTTTLYRFKLERPELETSSGMTDRCRGIDVTTKVGLRGVIVCLRQCVTSLGTCRTHDAFKMFHLPGTMSRMMSRPLVEALDAEIRAVETWTGAAAKDMRRRDSGGVTTKAVRTGSGALFGGAIKKTEYDMSMDTNRAEAEAEATAKAMAKAKAKAKATAKAKAKAKATAMARAKATAMAKVKARAEAKAMAKAETEAKKAAAAEETEKKAAAAKETEKKAEAAAATAAAAKKAEKAEAEAQARARTQARARARAKAQTQAHRKARKAREVVEAAKKKALEAAAEQEKEKEAAAAAAAAAAEAVQSAAAAELAEAAATNERTDRKNTNTTNTTTTTPYLTEHPPAPPSLSEACLVSYNSILDKTTHIDMIHAHTSRTELLHTFLQLMNDPIMESFDKHIAETIRTHLEAFLETPDTRKSEIYETCSDLVSMYLRQNHPTSKTHQTILLHVQHRLRSILYSDTYTVQTIADMIASILIPSEATG